MKTQDTRQICTSWISWRGFQITLNQRYVVAVTESNSSDFLSSSLPCLYSRNRESWAEVDALKICSGEPQTHFLPPPPCLEAVRASLSVPGRDGAQSWGSCFFFTQHESNSADASIGRICIHCPECNLNLLPALGSEITSAFQLPFPQHTGCCCCCCTEDRIAILAGPASWHSFIPWHLRLTLSHDFSLSSSRRTVVILYFLPISECIFPSRAAV